MQHLKKQFDNGVTTPYVMLLGSARKLSEAEKKNTENYARGAKTEFGLMNGALHQVLGVNRSESYSFDYRGVVPGAQESRLDADNPDAFNLRHYELPDGTHVLSISAPQMSGSRRANTADTYQFMVNIVGAKMLKEANKALNITTDLFKDFQDTDMKRLVGLPAGIQGETIGHGGVNRPPYKYAQEINSAWNQAYLLYEAVQQQE